MPAVSYRLVTLCGRRTQASTTHGWVTPSRSVQMTQMGLEIYISDGQPPRICRARGLGWCGIPHSTSMYHHEYNSNYTAAVTNAYMGGTTMSETAWTERHDSLQEAVRRKLL